MNYDALATTFASLLLGALSLLIIFLLWTPKKTKLPKSAYHQSLGRAGDSIKRYQPKRNLNRIINRLVCGEVKAFEPSAVIVQSKQIPDASFWQGLISWELMRSKTDAIILRAGQNTWVDSMFRINYASAKFRGMLRGVYFFWDDRVSPSDQLETLIEALGDDVPEMDIWVDYEAVYGGSFQGLRNVVAFMQAIEKAYPACRVGLYTGYYFFVEHTNAILNFSQYNYLKDKPLWLASYTDASAVRIPAPWTALDFWQWGTPAVSWGQTSAEIDMSYFNGTEQEFYNRYAGNTTPPTETEQPMARNKVTIVWSDGCRERSRNSIFGTPYEILPFGGVYYSDVDVVADADDPASPDKKWIQLQSGRFIATRYPSTSGTVRALVEPVPASTDEITVDIDVAATVNGKVYVGSMAGLQLKAQ